MAFEAQKLLTVGLCALVICVNFVTGQFVGDTCTGRSQAAGKCRLIDDCPQVRSELSKGLRPVTCGYENLRAIVCCPTANAAAQMVYTDAQKSTIRYQKCEEYKSAVYEKTYVLQLTPNAKPVEKLTDQCGFTAVPLIVGGTRATVREFPHSAILGYRTLENTIAWGCGGSLISKQFILTAAHCLTSQDYGRVQTARLGDLDISSDKDDARPENFDIVERISYPEYGRLKYHDIALLKLDRLVTFNPHIRPICLPPAVEAPKKGIATGWGAVEWAGSSSSSLLKVTLDTYSQVECNATYTRSPDRKLPRGIESTQLCAGSRTEARDTCQGDSGGPFQIYHPTIYCMYIQIGVTSFGRACGGINTPGVYTNVASYVDWIERTVWPNGAQVDE